MKDKTRKLITDILDFLILFFIYINLAAFALYLRFIFKTISSEMLDISIFSFAIVLILFFGLILFFIRKK